MRTEESITATCPDCRGPLSVVRTGSLVEIRCLVGHVYSVQTLLAAHCEAQEKALWAAVVSLREPMVLVESLSDQFTPEQLQKLRIQAEKKQAQATILEEILANLEPFEV